MGDSELQLARPKRYICACERDPGQKKVQSMKQLIKFGCWMMVACVFVMSAWGQNIATANLSGVVKDPSGAAINNAKVTVRDDSTGFTRTASTDDQGLYQFLSLPPATYRLTVEAPGFAKLSANNIKLAIGQAGQLPISMKLAATTETATVSAETQTLETQQTVKIGRASCRERGKNAALAAASE